jgi:hypothetical protein
MWVITEVIAEQVGPELIHFGQPVVEFLAANVQKEVTVPDGAHQSTRYFVFFQDNRISTGFSQSVGGCEASWPGAQNQCVHFFFHLRPRMSIVQ